LGPSVDRSAAGVRTQILGRSFLGLPSLLWLFLIIQSLAWILTPALLNRAPELNTAEISMWGREWFWVNYKHPGLPSWTMALAFWLFGVHVWVPYVVSQFFIWATYICVFVLGRNLFGDARSLVGTVLLAGVVSFSVSTLKFNHNIAQMPFWAGFCLGLWRASETRRLIWWLFAAAMAALGIYAKFSTGILIAFGSAWILFDSATRSQLRSYAPYVALAVFISMLAPLGVALAKIDFLPIRWMSAESANKGISTGAFLFGQALIVIGMLVLAALAGIVDLRRPARAAAFDGAEGLDRRRFSYLALLGAGPLALTLMLSVFARLRVNWTTPMYNLSGILLVAYFPWSSFSLQQIRRLCGLATAFSVALACGYGVWDLYCRYEVTTPLKSAWPMMSISKRFNAIWAQEVGQPLRIVAGDHWNASLVGIPAVSQPELFTNLDFELSPAVTPDEFAREGALVLWRLDSGWKPPADLLKDHVTGIETFQWSPNPKSHPIEIGYLILPPPCPETQTGIEPTLGASQLGRECSPRLAGPPPFYAAGGSELWTKD
jgi:4-amino-4-deoxy-L-arabinose transferase-like glycosyltransferase